MTLIKSILLGSAAGIVAVASAQAADLPTRKAAPVQYVQVCNVGGIVGWTLPGSDTCVKLSGYIIGQFEGGNLNTQYNWGGIAPVADALAATNPALSAELTALAKAFPGSTQRVLIAASDQQQNTRFFRHETGWTTRANFGFDFASNTAYGPLIGHFDINSENGNGFDNTGGYTYLNTGYLTWAGITAGKAASFFSFIGGGENWPNIFSPDQKGFNQPDLLAYTASFGGGFSATIALQSPGCNGGGGGPDGASCFPGSSGGGTQQVAGGNIVFGGERWPDIVGALHYKAGWGEAQVSGVIHDVNVAATGFQGATGFPPAVGGTLGCGLAVLGGPVICNSQRTHTGWGIDAGVKFLLPSWGAGDNLVVTGAYTESAVWYSGLPDGMWGENGQVNGNGQPMFLSDAFFNPLTNQWSTPRAWSIAVTFEHHFTPQFYFNPEFSYGAINWSNMGGGCNLFGLGCGVLQSVNGPLSSHAYSWIVGADIGWNPVTNLNFDLDLMYQTTHQNTPSGFLGTVYNLGGPGGAIFAPFDWHTTSSGFAGRLRITRYF